MSLFPTERGELESKIFLLETENEMFRNIILQIQRERREHLEDLKKYHTFFEQGYSQVNYIDNLIEKLEKRLKQ